MKEWNTPAVEELKVNKTARRVIKVGSFYHYEGCEALNYAGAPGTKCNCGTWGYEPADAPSQS